MGLKRVAWKGLASNGLAVKRIYISVFSGRGRAPKVREAGNARGLAAGKRRGAEVFKQKSSDLGNSPWYAPVREPARVFAMEQVPGLPGNSWDAV